MLSVVQEKEPDWLDISEDFLPFLAKNQFKKALKTIWEKSHNPKTKKKQDAQLLDCAQRIEMLLNPDKEIENDPIKVMMHIDHVGSQNTYIRIKGIDAYTKANLEGQKLQIRAKSMKNGERTLFSQTVNNLPDLLSLEQTHSQVKESNIVVIDGDKDSVSIGEGSIIQKSVIGRNV